MNANRISSVGVLVLAAALLNGCVIMPTTSEVAADGYAGRPVEADVAVPILTYLRWLQGMSPQELTRERNVLSIIEQTPTTQVHLAMLLGQMHGSADITRAQGLLESVINSKDPEAISLQPMARILGGVYQERLRLELMNEKLTQQMKESQRRVEVLQEKLNAMADIEHSIPVRSMSRKTLPGGAK